MLFNNNIKIDVNCQGFVSTTFATNEDNSKSVLMLASKRLTKDVVCPFCGGKVKIYDTYEINLKDIPFDPNMENVVHCTAHRYRCTDCKETFSEEIPFKYPGTRITWRAANWIKAFLRNKLSIRAIQNLTGIHWDTIRKVQLEIMEEALSERKNELLRSGYKPKYLPQAQIVYDRYHMQAQFGRDVLGVVRLDEARKHRARSMEILDGINDETDKETKRTQKEVARSEKRKYSDLKKSRWSLLMNKENLDEKRKEALNTILQAHRDLSICYAMKEEMCRLFEECDCNKATEGWMKWFDAAKASEVPALVKFAKQKEKRLPGLITHSIYPISTGKLEGFNNKIKVAKRIGYGFRNEDYFFTLIRYLSLSSVKSSPNFP